MAHHLPLMMATADGDEGGTPDASVEADAADAEDVEARHHQQLACHPQQLAAFHHQQ